MPNSKGQMVIAVDFDGVLNNYKGWKGMGVFEQPVPGAAAAMRALKESGWVIILYTSRAEVEAIRNWMNEHNIPFDYINQQADGSPTNPLNPAKPVADVYLDDRAVRFEGDWNKTTYQLLSMDLRPWSKKEE